MASNYNDSKYRPYYDESEDGRDCFDPEPHVLATYYEEGDKIVHRVVPWQKEYDLDYREKWEKDLDDELENYLNELDSDDDDLAKITELDLSDSGLTEVPCWIRNCINLTKLDLSDNYIGKIKKDNFPKSLRYLDIDDTILDLTKYDFS